MTTTLLRRSAGHKRRREFAFQHVRTTGPMLPADVLQRVASEDPKLPGLQATDYGLAENERLGQESGKRRPMHPRWVGYQLGKILDPDAILLDDADFKAAKPEDLKDATSTPPPEGAAEGPPAPDGPSEGPRRTIRSTGSGAVSVRSTASA